jgi:hypothetical protein
LVGACLIEDVSDEFGLESLASRLILLLLEGVIVIPSDVEDLSLHSIGVSNNESDAEPLLAAENICGTWGIERTGGRGESIHIK